MQQENQFRASVHKQLKNLLTNPKMVLGVYQEKMHNPYRRGTPDDWYSGHQRDLWVEYKYRKQLQSVLVDKLLSPLQLFWLQGRHQEGRNVAVIVGFPQGGIVVRPERFNERISIVEIETELLMKRKQLAEWIYNEVNGLKIESTNAE